MRKKRNKPRNRHGLQAVTLCISTAMVLVLLGLVVFSVLLGRNPTAAGMAYAFESRFFVSTASAPAAYDPAWAPGFLLFLQ